MKFAIKSHTVAGREATRHAETLDEAEARLIEAVRQHNNPAEALLIAAEVIAQYFTGRNVDSYGV